MSRIGRMPITVPAGVDVKLDGQHITVKGAKSTLEMDIHPDMTVKVDGAVITVERPSDDKAHRALHGLTRSLINNMVIGVSEGFSKELEINGVGYRATKQGNKVTFNLGYSHPIEVVEPEGITIEVPSQNQVIVKGLTSSSLARPQQRSVSSEFLMFISARVSSMLTSTLELRKERPELRSNRGA